MISHENIAHFCLLFDPCEIVNYHTDEEVYDELTTKNHEGHKVDDVIWFRI